MTEKEAIQKLIEIQGLGDTEIAHSLADDVLREVLLWVGYESIVIEYDKIDKWYA